MDRRKFLTSSLAAGLGLNACAAEQKPARARIAITLDLEMSANFPKWEDTHWNYAKGLLNEETRRYTVEACKRVNAHGGVIHCFAVGRVFEQEDVEWLKGIAKAGHPIGNHTYDHVNVKATRLEDLQFRFRRSPWLIDGQRPEQVIAENVRLTSVALKTRIAVDSSGFRTPGGFPNGLSDVPSIRRLLRDQGFSWVSSLYPRHDPAKVETEPGATLIDSILQGVASGQPFAYPDGLIEIPMSPISDIGAFRTGRWKLDWFLHAIRKGVEWAIEKRAVFDFLGHPSCLYVVDPEFRTIEMICDLVKKAGDKAAIVDLDTIAREVVKK